MTAKKKILIFSASLGSGHVKAAEAFCETCSEKFGGEIVHVDFFKCFNPTFTQLIEKSYNLMIRRAPEIWRLIYNVEEKPITPIKKMSSYLGIKKYCQLIEEHNPDLILSTHFFPAAIVSLMYPRFPIPNGVVLTDFVSHRMWIYPNNQKFFVAQDKMIGELKKFGVDKSKICVSGIPVGPCFSQPLDKTKLFKKLGLELGKPVILLMGGGSSIGSFGEVIKSLSKMTLEFQLLVIVGHSKKMRQELQPYFDSLKLKGKVLGFVNNVHEYMMASDLLISKAGGLTVTEALTVGLPMVIIRSIPGQEDGNTKFLVKSGAGIYSKDVDNINLLVEDLLTNRRKLEKMSKNALKYAKPQSVMTILKEMVELR